MYIEQFWANGSNDASTIAFLVLSVFMAFTWRDFWAVFLYKANEMLLSRDWRTFQIKNAKTGTYLNLFLTIIYVGSVSIFLYQLSCHVFEHPKRFWLFLILVIGIHLFRLLLAKLLEWIFLQRGTFLVWFNSYAWVNYTIGVFFFPLAILMTYCPEQIFSVVMYIAIGIFVISELLLIYRLFVVFSKDFSSLFYLFLYLCGLEIIPWLVVFRLMM